MKSDYDYQFPWRPIFEVYAISGWLGGAGLAHFTSRWSGLPPEPFDWLMTACGVMACWRLSPALSLWYRKRRLRQFRFQYLDAEKLVTIVKRDPESLWFGWGFDWVQKHAQLAYEILKRDVSTLIPSDHQRMGSAWIHGLEVSESDIRQPLQHTAGHTLLVGTTGAGKTRAFDVLVTQAVLRGEAVIIIDPKGDKDLMACAKRACTLAKRPDRFVYFHPAFPEDSVRLDPLHNFNRPSEIASRISAISPSESSNDPFKAFGQKSLDNVIQGLMVIEERPTLVKLRRYLEGGPSTLVIQALERYFDNSLGQWRHEARSFFKKAEDIDSKAACLVRFYREVVQYRVPNLDLEGLLSLFEHDRAHFSKMVASLIPIMNMLTSGSLGPLLSPNPHDVDDLRPITNTGHIIEKAQVAYIGLDSLSDGMVGSAIGSILLADLAAVAGDRYNYGVSDRPVNVFVDEAAEVINDPFIQVLNKGRGAKIRLFIATQTFADFAARTGSQDKARQVLGNVNNLIALRIMDSETQQYITDNLPKTRLKYIMRTQGVATSATNPTVFSGNVGERLMEEEGDLFAPQLLGQLPDLHYIAKLSGGRIVKGRLPILRSELDQQRNRQGAGS
jgi:conjugal transfer pilus assembly protein TraD